LGELMTINNERVAVYVDGFNLYFGMKESGWRRYYWLNVESLATNLLRPNQNLVKVKYFTSRVFSKNKDQSKQKRQNKYLEALETLPNTELYFGHYLIKDVKCPSCSFIFQKPEEKMTDVNIASEMIIDSYLNKFDTAMLISGDSDLVRPIQIIKSLSDTNRIVVAFPPRRFSSDLKNNATAYFVIGRANLSRSQFPENIVDKKGYTISRPSEWI